VSFCEDSYILGLGDAIAAIDTRPATKKQKDLMKKLGMKTRKDMTLVEAKIRINAVLEVQKNQTIIYGENCEDVWCDEFWK